MIMEIYLKLRDTYVVLKSVMNDSSPIFNLKLHKLQSCADHLNNLPTLGNFHSIKLITEE